MARGLSLTAWAGLAGLFALGALIVWPFPATLLDWQPARPWRAFSAAFVHLSLLHLLANLLGCAVVAALGLAARLPRRSALAWALAWPLAQLGLLAVPSVAHFGGLSGVLHAGVAVAVVELLFRPGRDRRIGLAVGAGLLLKLWLEQPLAEPLLRHGGGWDIAVLPFSHLSGAVAGALCALIVRVRDR